jgi:hypothetical protein
MELILLYFSSVYIHSSPQNDAAIHLSFFGTGLLLECTFQGAKGNIEAIY